MSGTQSRPHASDEQLSSLLAAEDDYSGRNVLEGFKNASFLSLIPFMFTLAFTDVVSFFRSRFVA